MRKAIKPLIFLLTLFVTLILSACDNKLDIEKENGATITAGKYSFKVEADIDGLSLSLTDEEYKKLIESGETEILLPSFQASAHDPFESVMDIINPTKWYTAMSDDPNSSEMNPNSMKHFASMDELTTRQDNISYIFKFDYILNVGNECEDTIISIDEVKLPEYNIVSLIFIGPNGYQEMESDGEYVSEGVLTDVVKPGSSVNLSFILYVNGNDANCTTQKISKYSSASGEFKIKLKTDKIN